LGDSSLIRLRPERVNHVWPYDFVARRTHLDKPIRLLTVIDEWSRECLAIKVAPRLRSDDVLATLTELMVRRGVPAYIRSDNGPEFTAKRVRDWIERIGAKTLFIETIYRTPLTGRSRWDPKPALAPALFRRSGSGGGRRLL